MKKLNVLRTVEGVIEHFAVVGCFISLNSECQYGKNIDKNA